MNTCRSTHIVLCACPHAPSLWDHDFPRMLQPAARPKQRRWQGSPCSPCLASDLRCSFPPFPTHPGAAAAPGMALSPQLPAPARQIGVLQDAGRPGGVCLLGTTTWQQLPCLCRGRVCWAQTRRPRHALSRRILRAQPPHFLPLAPFTPLYLSGNRWISNGRHIRENTRAEALEGD